MLKTSLNELPKMKRHSFILLVIFIKLINCDINKVDELTDLSIWERTLLNVSSENFRNSFLPNYVNFEQDVLDNDNVGQDCKNSFQNVLHGLESRQYWAAKLFNSWAKFPPSGFLHGTMVDFGDYDQCLYRMQHNLKILTSVVNSQYCLVDVAVPMERPIPFGHNLFNPAQVLPKLPNNDHVLSNDSIYRHLEKHAAAFYYAFIQIGVCIPEKCSKAEVKAIFNSSITKYGFNLEHITCNTNENYWKFNSVQITAILFLLIISTVTLCAGIYDNFTRDKAYDKKNGGCGQFLIWFSPLRNARKLIYTKSQDDDLSCVHGLRVITMTWIVAGHSMDWNKMNSFRETFTLKERLTEIVAQPFYRALLTVDTFFFLSGLLTSYVTLKYTKGKYENFNSRAFLLLRYLRLSPQLAAWLLLTFLLPSLFTGPLWNRYIGELDRCYTNWWINMVYLQNVIDVRHICGLHTWYIAADMQLHWISLIPVLIWLKNPKLGKAFIGGVMFLSITISGATLYLQKLPPGSVMTSKNDLLDENGQPTDFLKFIYNPWTHAHVFFIGFLFGDYMKNNEKRLKLVAYSKTTKYLLWFSAIGGFCFSIYSVIPWVLGRPYEPFWSAILFPLNLLTWSLAMALTIWLSSTANSGILGSFLSAPFFRPLSRLTYSVYLTHVWVVWIVLGARRDLIDLHWQSLLLQFCALILLSFAVGFVFTILFESPVICALNCLKHKLFPVDIVEKKENNEAEKQMVALNSIS